MHKGSYSHPYLQCFMWHNSPFIKTICLNPVKYGYKFDEGEDLVPAIMTELSIPVGLSVPCNDSKC